MHFVSNVNYHKNMGLWSANGMIPLIAPCKLWVVCKRIVGEDRPRFNLRLNS